MSGETAKEESGWTVDTVLQHLEQQIRDLEASVTRRLNSHQSNNELQFVAQEKAVQIALAEREKAAIKAETATDKRFESVNEFRQTLTDQAVTFIRRSEAEARVASLDEKLAETARRLEEQGIARDKRLGEIEQFRALSTAQQANVEGRMHQLNQLREEVTTDRGLYILREAHETQVNVITGKLAELQLSLTAYVRADTQEARQSRADGVHEAQDYRISELENWRSKAIGVGSVLVLASGVIGAVILKAFGG